MKISNTQLSKTMQLVGFVSVDPIAVDGINNLLKEFVSSAIRTINKHKNR